MADPRIQQAIELMAGFAERTGLTGERPQRRYLWTDAFAVCNFIGLAKATGDAHDLELALKLVDGVHHTLGRHRADDARTGWISGLSERDGEAHPTRGGLRIGKELPERGPNEPIDERLEWDRDGQYFHYLTQWMRALDQLAAATGQARFNLWARELAETAQRAFMHRDSFVGRSRLYWKMSIDLTRPQVSSMGQHDPLDGYVTALQLRATAARLGASVDGPELKDQINQLASMVQRGDWTTADPLGLGGLLVDAYRLEQLIRQGIRVEGHLPEMLLAAALAGLRDYARSGELQLPAEHRLAFRELGLAIGLRAVRRMWEADDRNASAAVTTRLRALMAYTSLGEEIEAFWRDPSHRRTRAWEAHRDIDEVMLATSLVPDGFLVLGSTR